MYAGKIPAFTLPELVVGLLLMAILFSVLATVYTILGNQSAHYFATNRFFTDYYITKKQLQQDFEKARTIRLNPAFNQIILQNNKGITLNTIVYQLDSAFIVRTYQGRSDTLLPGAWIAAQRNVNDTSSLLAFLKLQHHYGAQPFYTFLQKRYARTDILYDSSATDP